MAKKFHMGQSVRGALMNWKAGTWKNVCRNSQGRIMTPAEVKGAFLEELSKGREVIPLCDPKECPNFDYSGNGCPGHEVTE